MTTRECPECEGYGHTLSKDYPEQHPCDPCDGTGQIRICTECGDAHDWEGSPVPLRELAGHLLCPVCVECGVCGAELKGTPHRFGEYLVCPEGKCLMRSAREADEYQRDVVERAS